MIKKRAKMIPALIAIWAVSIAAIVFMQQLEPSLWARDAQFIPGYEIWLAGTYDTPVGKLLYVLANWTECHGLMCWLAGAVMVGSGIVAHAYLRKNKDKKGIKMYPPAGPGGGYLGMVASGFVGLLVANLLWGFRFDVAAGVTYIAVFIVCCAVPQALTLTYGNNWKVWLTAGAICGIVQYPFEEFSLWLANNVLHIPPLVLFTTFVVLGTGLVCVELFKVCPWVRKYVKDPSTRQQVPYAKTDCGPRATGGWLVRRTLADWTEIMFFGNEWVGLATIAALVLSWFLNPFSVVYATPDLLPGMVFSSIMAGSLSLFIYEPKYEERGFFNTFVTVSAMLIPFLFFGMGQIPAATSLPLLVVSAIIVAFIAPLICDKCFGWLSSKLSKRYEGVVLGVLCNAPSIGVTVFFCFMIISGLLYTGVFI